VETLDRDREVCQEFGTRLAAMRAERGFKTPSALARASHVSYAELRKMEDGQSIKGPSLVVISRLAEALKLRAWELVAGKSWDQMLTGYLANLSGRSPEKIDLDELRAGLELYYEAGAQIKLLMENPQSKQLLTRVARDPALVPVVAAFVAGFQAQRG